MVELIVLMCKVWVQNTTQTFFPLMTKNKTQNLDGMSPIWPKYSHQKSLATLESWACICFTKNKHVGQCLKTMTSQGPSSYRHLATGLKAKLLKIDGFCFLKKGQAQILIKKKIHQHLSANPFFSLSPSQDKRNLHASFFFLKPIRAIILREKKINFLFYYCHLLLQHTGFCLPWQKLPLLVTTFY